MLRTRIQILLYFLFTSLFLHAQSIDYSNLMFEHLSIEDGLSQITVHSILQDSQGFLWFGTEDGLNRYDGYNFVIYRHDPNDSNSISDNFIWSMVEDKNNNLIIGTNNGGLTTYNYLTDSFINYSGPNYEKLTNIRIVFKSSLDKIWIGTENSGLYSYDDISQSIVEKKISQTMQLSIRSICEDMDGFLWIGTDDQGIFVINNESEVIKHFTSTNTRLKSNSIWSLACDKNNNIWIGTYNAGLFKYDKADDKIYEYSNSKRGLLNNNVTSIFIDSQDNLWICTEGGLSIMDQHNGGIINYEHSVSDLRSISNNLLRFISVDNSKLIWIGTVGGGVNKLNLNKKFKQFNHNPSDENSLSHNMIRAIEEDSKNNLWIGTLGSGLNRYDRAKNKFQRFNSRELQLSENVSTILEDGKNNLWVGMWGGGLNKIKFTDNYSVKSIESYRHSETDRNTISNDIVQEIFEDSRGNLWIGTEDGLDKINIKNNSIEHYKQNVDSILHISDNRIQSRCIFEDRYGFLWVGTWRGLNRIDIRQGSEDGSPNKTFQMFKENGLSDNRIISLHEEYDNENQNKMILWVGTIGGGLNKIDVSIENGNISHYQIENFNKMNGLPSNVIYGILGDNENNLWLSTNNGLSKFNKSSKNFRNYDINDGLQSNQFFWGAFHKTRDGEFFFGGINGLNSFFADQLEENVNIPPVYITECYLESTSGSYTHRIKNIHDIKKSDGIKLPYNSYNIYFQFASLDYVTPSKNKYKYLFENIDDTWSEETYLNTVQYSNITEGEYKFNLIGSNNDGIWNEKIASFNIIIETPFWKTWWFISLLIICSIGLIVYFIATQIKNVLAVERLRTKLAADLHDNIGSSLTEISILSEVITTRIKSEDDEIIKSLDKISDKSRKLIDKMSDIVWLVNPQRDSLYDLILRLQDTYSDLLADTEISFTSENLKSLEKVSLSMEHRQHLFLIFKEAINNAITHSDCTEINLNANVSGKFLTMLLKDNGRGFDLQLESHGNGVKNMMNRSKKIGGKFTINSEIGIGTFIKYIGHIH